MDLTIIATAAGWQRAHAQAMLEGATRLGINAIHGRPGGNLRSKTIACWSWHVGKNYRAAGANVLVMERGYLGDRFAWTSLGWNGLNGRARFPFNPDPSRFRRYFGDQMKPWRKAGDYALLIGQVPGDASLSGQDLTGWYRATAVAAARAYGLPVAFRRHPKAVEKGVRQTVPGTRLLEGELADALAGAAVVLTFNSNVGVDAVMAGCPVVAVDRGSMAWDVAAHKIGEFTYPDREDWGTKLAWCQWTIDEIRSGEALVPMFDLLKEAA